ncbi:type IV secretory pathway VirB2 component (pilin) [Skermanella aerolata]|uniref:TrbC/VirB2 family protein n=1 Tax=Skermanella aerolata TaxID=393310 RepID=UPI003D1EC847
MPKINRLFQALALGCATLIVTTAAADAAVTGGGAMPYDAGLTTFSASIRGTIAGILIVIGVVGGVGMWIAGGQLDGMLQTIARVIIGACIVGGVVAFLSAIGVAGAVI